MSMPYNVIVDKNGNIRKSYTGYYPGQEKEIRKTILEILNESR